MSTKLFKKFTRLTVKVSLMSLIVLPMVIDQSAYAQRGGGNGGSGRPGAGNGGRGGGQGGAGAGRGGNGNGSRPSRPSRPRPTTPTAPTTVQTTAPTEYNFGSLPALNRRSNINAWKQNYIGNMTIKLTDVPNYASTLQAMNNAINASKTSKTQMDAKKAAVVKANNLIKKFNQEINQLNAQIVANVQKINNLQDQIDASPGPQNEAKRIQLEEEITKLETQNVAKLETTNNKVTQRTNATNQVANLKVQHKNASQAYHNAEVNRINATNNFYQVEARVIARVSRMNALGAEAGHEQGHLDGVHFARITGERDGGDHGSFAGQEDGIADGKQREFNSGYSIGSDKGAQVANENGQVDGEREGRIAGNENAATIKGNADGQRRAEGSDASSVGQRQGIELGTKRADQQGRADGEALAERQVIEKHEGSLPSQTINGQFTGVFRPRTPGYAGFNCVSYNGRIYTGDNYEWRRHNYREAEYCPNFRPRGHREWRGEQVPVMRQAFMDGYLRPYRHARRRAYNDNIDAFYNEAYERAYTFTFRDFSTRSYPVAFENGQSTGYNETYNEVYPQVKRENFDIAYSQYTSNPQTSSPEYTGTYRSVEPSSYSRNYEAIRKSNKDKYEASTYATNYPLDKEKYRKARYAVVDGIYLNNSVLAFNSFNTTDEGVSKVGNLDQIYMPGEDMSYDVSITNFGHKAATGVKLTNEHGTTITLPSIPARGTYVIKKAAKSLVPTSQSIGSTHTSKILINAPVTAESKIQARHFSNPIAEVLTTSAIKNPVKYPLVFEGLKLSKTLLINETNSLSTGLSKLGKKTYVGPIEIELTVNSNTDIISKGFSDLSEIKSSLSLSGAKVLVSSTKDVFSPLTFSLVARKNGVVLGKSRSALSTMAKAPYSEKEGKPVIVVNAESTPRDLMDLISNRGGFSKVSVLDSSLSLNDKHFSKGLSSKVVLVVDNGRGSSLTGVNQILKNSYNVVTIFMDDNSKGLEIARQSSMIRGKQAFDTTLKIAKFGAHYAIYTNMYTTGAKDTNIAITATFQNLDQKIELANILKRSDSAHINTVASILNSGNFGKQTFSMELLIAQATAQLTNIGAAWLAQGKPDSLLNLATNSNDPLFRNLITKGLSSSSLTHEAYALSSVMLDLLENTSLKQRIAEGFSQKFLTKTRQLLRSSRDNAKSKLKSQIKSAFPGWKNRQVRATYENRLDNVGVYNPFN